MFAMFGLARVPSEGITHRGRKGIGDESTRQLDTYVQKWMMNAGAHLAFSFSFSLESQFMEWCHP